MILETKKWVLERKEIANFTSAFTSAKLRRCGDFAEVQVFEFNRFAEIAEVSAEICGDDLRESFKINVRGGAEVKALPTGVAVRATLRSSGTPLDGGPKKWFS
jgi:hypothetical protein